MIVVTPAYGRDYKSRVEILADWNGNLDFLVQPEERYTNKEDCEKLGYRAVQVRYANIRKQTVLNRTEKGWK